MAKYCTEIVAVCPHTGLQKNYGGEPVEADSPEAAQAWLDANGKGYMKATSDIWNGEIEWDGVKGFSKGVNLLSKFLNKK